MTAADLIKQLQLARHPEGGWYRETYRCQEQVPADALPQRFCGERPFSTAIYFLLEPGEISALHRIRSDEIWHYHAGGSVVLHLIRPDGSYEKICLGADLTAGDQFQAVIPAGCWFGADLSGDRFALVGCTVAPGFDFTDFELAGRVDLMQQHPEHAALIIRLTKP